MIDKASFPELSSELIGLIDEVAELKTIPAGQVIMRTGQFIRNMMIVTRGMIKVYREDEEGGEFFMYYLPPGQACSITMIGDSRNEKSQIMAKAIEETDVLLIPLSVMDQWMVEHKDWYNFVIENYRRRFDEVLQVLDSIAFQAMDERLEHYLKRQSEMLETEELNISHQEIANDLNSSREVISRLLKKMEQRGMVSLHRNAIELLTI